MDFIDALRVLLRRWRVMAVGAAVVLAAAAAAVALVPTQYQATGQLVMLLPPQATGAATPTNPYLNLEPGLTVTASLIASTLSTKDSARSLEAAGFTSDYAIGLSPDAGPVLVISTEDTDGAMAVRTRDEVIRRLQVELARIQSAVNAPQRQLIDARPNSAPSVAEPLPGSKIRALAVIGGVGVVTTLLVAFIRDRRRPEEDREEVRAAAPTPRATPRSRADERVRPDAGERLRPAEDRPRERVSASAAARWWDS
ncbi:hypothetical protein ACFFOM_17215 [Microlunatus capsulatus]|uniref:Capsular polysaccharide biosynthesis protein n=1 Tax=Microlunatus capsulatus TaxID=99117 RepID=A0ABS4ZC15_9ACTN|nr:hypothetical protein [Microlunatus capsulatus]MBP2418566.1 hypothetical protein [Microlunatus capsulatus]